MPPVRAPRPGGALAKTEFEDGLQILFDEDEKWLLQDAPPLPKLPPLAVIEALLKPKKETAPAPAAATDWNARCPAVRPDGRTASRRCRGCCHRCGAA